MSEASPSPKPPDPLRVLIVEDNDADYLLLLRRVQKILPVSPCHRAICRAELMTELVFGWDLIITDLHLLDIESEELLATIALAQPKTPCLVITGSLPEQDPVAVTGTVFRVLEKGDNAGLQAALEAIWKRAQ